MWNIKEVCLIVLNLSGYAYSKGSLRDGCVFQITHHSITHNEWGKSAHSVVSITIEHESSSIFLLWWCSRCCDGSVCREVRRKDFFLGALVLRPDRVWLINGISIHARCNVTNT